MIVNFVYSMATVKLTLLYQFDIFLFKRVCLITNQLAASSAVLHAITVRGHREIVGGGGVGEAYPPVSCAVRTILKELKRRLCSRSGCH